MENESVVAAAPSYGEALAAKERRRSKILYVVLAAVFAAAFCWCILTGKYYTSPGDVFRCLLWGIADKCIWLLELPTRIPGLNLTYTIPNPIPVTWDSRVTLVLLSIRVPRVLGAMLAGGGLAISGASYQSVFRNPLVSESILGVSSGACFGAMLAVVLELGHSMTYTLAFVFAAATVLAVYLIGHLLRGNPTLTLVLVGTVLSSLLSAGYSILRYMADPISSQMSDFMFWLMGSLSRLDAQNMGVLFFTLLLGGTLIMSQRGRMNGMSLGEEQARSLGIHTGRVRFIIILASTVITAVVISECGTIGWIGLMIPQIVRMIAGPDNRRLIPCSFFAGGIFLMVIDMIVRVPASGEVPVGVLSAMVGTPIFLLALIRQKAGWS